MAVEQERQPEPTDEIEAVVEDFEPDEKGMGKRPVVIPVDVMDDEEEEKVSMPVAEDGAEEDPAVVRKRRRAQLLAELAELDNAEKAMGEDDEEEEMLDEEDEEEELPVPTPQALRVRRLANMGMKSAEIAEVKDDAIFCAIERKMLKDGSPCDWCRGGCAPEQGLPGLLDIEAHAEFAYKGVVLDSGYAPNDDIFVVDIKRESDGAVIEAFYSGEGKQVGWLYLDQDQVGEKAEPVAGQKMIGSDEAEEIAVKELPGTALGVGPTVFEGYDAYVVEIEGLSGKSYDAFVALDGSFLGFDEYDLAEMDEEATGEKELDETIEYKRDFSADKRRDFAKRGLAMEDGSFPIENEGDLKNAIGLVGNAKDPAAAKAHVMKRAAQLGLEKLIPEAWLGKDSEKGEDGDDVLIKELMEFQMMVAEDETKDIIGE